MSTELINRPREGYQLTGFYGGDARGYCLQITSDHGYVQVTREGAALLAADILRYFLEVPGPAEAQATLAELELRTAAAVAAGVPGVILPGAPCPTCGAKGFDKSRLGPDRCTFCDGTEGGNPPEEDRDAG